MVNAYTGLSCPTTSLCIGTCPPGFGAGGGGDCDGPSYYSGTLFTWRPPAFHPPSTPSFSTISPFALNGIWCVAASLCFAADDLDLFASTDPAGGSAAWQPMYSQPHPTTFSAIEGVACPRDNKCIAVDAAGELLAGTPPPSATAIKASLMKLLVPRGPHSRVRSLLAASGYVVRFDALTIGRLSIDWETTVRIAHHKTKSVVVAAAHATFAKATVAKLKLKLTRRGRQILRTAKHLKLRAKASFTEPWRPPVGASRTFKLR
jgi:hypothetical protein